MGKNLIELLQYFILGLIQGVAEPLPISSSGHVLFLSTLFKLELPDNFDLWVNLGSFIAIILFFRLFIWDLIKGFFIYLFKKDETRKKDFYYCLFIVIATIPAGLIGLIFKEQFSKLALLLVVGISELVTGTILILVSLFGTTEPNKEIDFKTSLGMGLSQVFALIPGLSRSGLTTSYALSQKVDLKKALKFSFMMYLPISLASTFLGLMELETSAINWSGYGLAFIASFGGTYLVMHWFFKFITKERLKYFGFYCLSIGLVILIYLGVVR